MAKDSEQTHGIVEPKNNSQYPIIHPPPKKTQYNGKSAKFDPSIPAGLHAFAQKRHIIIITYSKYDTVPTGNAFHIFRPQYINSQYVHFPKWVCLSWLQWSCANTLSARQRLVQCMTVPLTWNSDARWYQYALDVWTLDWIQQQQPVFIRVIVLAISPQTKVFSSNMIW
jgi:hypothetical protein